MTDHLTSDQDYLSAGIQLIYVIDDHWSADIYYNYLDIDSNVAIFNGDLGFPASALQPVQAALHPRNLPLVIGLGKLRRKIEGFEHGGSLFLFLLLALLG